MSTPAHDDKPRLRMPFAGADWLENNLGFARGTKVSNLGQRVAEALGFAFCGLYHLRSTALFHERTQWDDPRVIAIVISSKLTNVDSDNLARLLAACASLGLRLAIEGAANGYLRLSFWRMGERYGGIPPLVETFELPARPARIIAEEAAPEVRGGA